MPYHEIAKALQVSKSVAKRAYRYQSVIARPEGPKQSPGEEEQPMWYPSLYRVLFPHRRYAWHRVRILRETDKAILVYNGGKIWVPKARIRGIRLAGNMLEIYVPEGTLG